MEKANCLLILVFTFFLLNRVAAQTTKDIQGTWRLVSTKITDEEGKEIMRMDSSAHNLTKVITPSRIMFTIYNRQTNNLMVTGQGKAMTKGNQYIETIEQSTGKVLLNQPMVFTYKVENNKLTYEGGRKDFYIVEVLYRIE